MADETKDPSEVKVGVITDVGGVNDGSFNQSAWEGLTRANEELGITTNYLESHTDSDYIPNLETFIDEEYDLIICIGYQLADAMKRVDNACYDEAKEILEGGFTQGIQTFTLADGGVDIAPTTDNIDPEVLKKVDEVKEKIISGEIEVPTDKESFDAKYGDVYQLDD